MSGAETGSTLVTADFAGRPCRFQLRLREMAELERLCGAGIGAIFMRLGMHQFPHQDVWDAIRLGLEGSGLSGIAASALVLRYQDDPLMDHLPLAGRIVAAAANGVPKAADAAGNAEAEEEGTAAPATSRSSTAPGRSRASRRKRSAG
ncbi:gene transfer agent family protein [Methylobacterium fujisawaense]|uniref:gene transfer agent family protein n=1 Tax=Methylobacterium fujisawaense TaxID=107400 RepID=UPI00313B2887